MKSLKREIKKDAGKLLVSFLLATTIIWSLGASLLTLAPMAGAAATSVEITTIGLPNQNPGSPIGQSSPMMPIAKVIINTDAAQTLTSIGVAFGGSGFVVGDLNALFDNNISSGIALYNDAGVGNTGFFGAGDLLIPLTGLAWNGSNILITPASTENLSSGSNVYFIVIRTSAIAADGHIINASIAQNGVVTNGGNGPSVVGGFTTNGYRVDAAPLSILSATGAVGSPAVNVRFSKPVQKIGGGSLVAASFTISGGKTISSVNHNPGMDFAGLTLSANLASGDFAPAPIIIAAASNAIVDMGGNVLATTPATNLVNAPIIDTTSIPSATAGTAYSSGSPLVTFAASGGTGAGTYRWAAGDQFATDTLTNLGLTLGATDGKLTTATTLADKPGSYFIKIKVTDNNGTGAMSEKVFGINIAPSGGGGIPGVSSITPPGGAKGSSISVTITGTNTHFSSSSTVQFLSGGTNDTKVVAGTVISSGATNISFPVAIDATATDGSRDVRITTGTEIVTMPYGFNVFMSGGSGLNLFVPSSNATNVPIPPNFNFSASSNSAINSYRITVNSASDFSGTTLWDYAFSRTGGHCDASGCNVNYGAGQFLILTQPTPLAPNTAYFWKVRTYTGQSVSPLTGETETTNASGFTTVSSLTDTMPPGIQHRPIFQAKAATDLNLFARVMDNMAKGDTTPPLTSKIFYCAGSGCTPTTEGAAPTDVGGGYYKFVIPGVTIGASGTIVRYYLQASDGSNTINFKGPGDVPFQMTSAIMTGTSTITGTVKDSAGTCAAGVQNATVFTDGMGFSATTDGSCAYTLSSLSAGTYDLVAIKGGYSDRRMDGIPAGSSNINFQLNQGFGGGFGGDLSKPHIKWTGPNDGMNGIPGGDSNFKIFVAFDKPMSQMSVTTAGNMTVNEVNMSTGELTNISPPATTTLKGTWAYYTSPQPNIPPESSLAVWSFSGTNTFGDNKNIAVKVTPNVTDTAGNPIQGNQPDGGYAFMFTTGSTANFSGFNSSTGTFSGGGTFGQGAFMPPHVNGVMPAPGSFDVPRNAKIVINFSDPMADDGGGYLLKNFVKLYTTSGFGSSAETDVSSSAISTVTLDSAKMSATVTLSSGYNSGTFAASTSYRFKVLGGAKAANGMTISPPDQVSNAMFISEFKTGTGSDTAAPNIVGSYPIDDPNGATTVPVNIGAINVGFNKDMDVSTITNTTFYLSVGSTTVNGTVEYRGLERQAYFIPKNALNPSTTYTINVTTDVKGVNGAAVAATATQPLTRTFKTGVADTGVPSITFMNADDYGIALTFSEPMNAAKATDTLNWATSVINPSAYHLIKYGDAMFNAVGGQGTAIPLTAATFKYDSTSNTVIIEGLDLKSAIGKEVYLEMDIDGSVVGNPNISKDLSGNQMTSPGNVVRTRIQDSQTTKGALGPMAMSGSAFGTGGGFVPTNFCSTNCGSGPTFGFAPPTDVKPFNMMAGQSTIYGVRLPISRQIPAGGSIILTFPTGFDVANAQQDINSPMRQDLNGPGTGTLTFKCAAAGAPTGASCSGTANTDDAGATQGGLAGDGVVVNTSARTVTVYLSAATNVEGHDFLTIDVSRIVNSTVPKDFNTSGYTVDIKTKDGATVLESLTSMPFFIQAGGSYTLSGTITATGNTANGDMKVYLMSPMTGPMEKTVSFAGSDATENYSFTNLPQGDYMLFTDQSVFIGASEYVGKTMPEPAFVNAGTDLSSDGSTNNVVDYDFTLASASGGTTVTVNVTGGPASEPMDVFAGSPTGFRVKQITLNGSGAVTSTLGLADGTWFVGVGPQMPKGPMSGPPPAPTYMPPKPKEIRISGGSCTVDGAVGCSLTYTLATSNKKIKGAVKDGLGKVMANAEVYGYSPNGGFGTHAQSDSAGNFTLNVVSGSFVIGAFVPGMPSSKEVSVIVSAPAGVVTDDTAYLLIDGATTAISPNAAATAFVLKVAKPDYTISGKVTDGTNVVQGASVYAYRTNGPGHAEAMTDSSGNYTLYVSGNATTAHTWNVGSFLPQYGQLTEQSVSISTSNASNINFSPSQTGTFYEVSGRVYKDVTTGGGFNGADVALQGAFVRISGNGAFNETITGTDGKYSFKVKEGSGYTLKAFAPGIGDLPPITAVSVSGAAVPNKDFAVSPPSTVTFTLSTSVTDAFIDAFSTLGMGSHAEIRNGTTGMMSLPNGDYKVNVHIPGVNIGLTDITATDYNTTTYNNTTGIVTVNGNEGLTITFLALRTVSGTVTDGTNNVPNAWVEIGNPTTGVHFGTQTNANGAFSLKVANSSSNYIINAMKPGYFREASTLAVNDTVLDAALATQILTVSLATTTISGNVYIGATGTVGAPNAFIRAEKQGGGFSGTQADANGVYSLPVNAGTWKVYAVAEGYGEAAYASNPVVITTTSATGVNVRLTTTISMNAPKSKPITPSSGGTLEDATSGIKLTIPANAMGSSTSAGTIQTKETNNVRETSSAKPLKKLAADGVTYVNGAKQITATDSSGGAITTLNDSVTVEMTYTKEELAQTASSGDSSINTKTESDNLKMAYWDETTSNWVTLPSIITYKDSNGATMDSSTTNLTPSASLSNVSAVIISAPTTHFSLYAPVSSTNAMAPSTPSGFSATAASASQINLAWTAVSGATSYDIYRSASLDGTYARLGSEPTVSSGSTTSYSDSTGLSASTAYYYKITSLNASGESAASSAVSATTQAGGGGGIPAGGGSASQLTGSVIINNNAAQTTSRNVTLQLSSTGAAQMAVSNSSVFEGAAWEAYVASKDWILNEGDGLKNVYAKFKNSSGAVSSIASDSITLNTTGAETPTTPETTAIPETSSAEPEGTLIRYSDSPKVYVVKNGNQVWIQTLEEFKAAGYKWENVKVITAAVKKEVGSVTLLQAEGDNKVYVIHNNKKRHIPSAQALNAAGYKWEEIKVITVPELANYSDQTSYEDGALVKSPDSPKVYVIKGGKRAWIPSIEAFNKAGYKWTNIMAVDAPTVSGYEETSFEDSISASTSGTVVITARQLRVRSSGTTASKTLGFAKQGEKYSILDESGNWYKIKTSSGAVGWVSGGYAKKQ